MPPIDYNAILSPHGAAQGFAELASTIAKIPQIRRQQKLEEIKAALQQKRADQADADSASLARYHDAMASAAGGRADAYGRSVDIHGQAVENQNANRDTRTGAQVGHWHAEDQVNQQRADEAGRTNDLRETGLTLEAGKMVPTDTYTPDTDAFGHTHSVRSSLPITPQQRISQGHDLMLQARPAPAARYGQALGGSPPAAAPPMQAPAPMQAAPPMQQASAPAQAGDPLADALSRAHPADQAAYQRILATGDPARIRAAQQRLLGAGGAAGAPPNAAP